MTNILFYIIALIFGACRVFLELVADLFGWTYTEACVYFNLYLQYVVLMLSALSVVYMAARKMVQEYSTRRLVVLILSVLYNIPYVGLGAWLYKRYGKISCEAAFEMTSWHWEHNLTYPPTCPTIVRDGQNTTL